MKTRLGAHPHLLSGCQPARSICLAFVFIRNPRLRLNSPLAPTLLQAAAALRRLDPDGEPADAGQENLRRVLARLLARSSGGAAGGAMLAPALSSKYAGQALSAGPDPASAHSVGVAIVPQAPLPVDS